MGTYVQNKRVKSKATQAEQIWPMHLLLSFAEGTLKVLDGHQAFFLQSQNAARGSPPVLQTIHDLSFPIVSYWYMGEQKKHCFSIMC